MPAFHHLFGKRRGILCPLIHSLGPLPFFLFFLLLGADLNPFSAFYAHFASRHLFIPTWYILPATSLYPSILLALPTSLNRLPLSAHDIKNTQLHNSKQSSLSLPFLLYAQIVLLSLGKLSASTNSNRRLTQRLAFAFRYLLYLNGAVPVQDSA